MRWYKKPKPFPGEYRIKNKFLILPLYIQGETRWLEKASWEERFFPHEGLILGGTYFIWTETKWIND